MSDFVSSFFGSLIAAGSVAFLTQKWIAGREFRNRQHELRVELYLAV